MAVVVRAASSASPDPLMRTMTPRSRRRVPAASNSFQLPTLRDRSRGRHLGVGR